jgi:hypothetical protein
MAKSPKSDPTKDPEFQKVVSHFLKTPPERHDTKKKDGGPKKSRRPVPKRSTSSES